MQFELTPIIPYTLPPSLGQIPPSTPSFHTLPPHCPPYTQVDGPPSFLDPEATRQMAAPASFLGRSGLAAEGGEGGMAAGGSGGPRMAPGPGFDISKLAPKLKGDKR